MLFIICFLWVLYVYVAILIATSILMGIFSSSKYLSGYTSAFRKCAFPVTVALCVILTLNFPALYVLSLSITVDEPLKSPLLAISLVVFSIFAIGANPLSLWLAIFPQGGEKGRLLILENNDSFVKKMNEALLGRLQIFKNSSRNVNLFRAIYIYSFLVTIVNTTLILIWKIEPEVLPVFLKNNVGECLVSLISSFLAIYLFLEKDYKEKWYFCSKVYESYIVCDDNDKRRDLFNKLVSDILQFDLWAKRSFVDIILSDKTIEDIATESSAEILVVPERDLFDKYRFKLSEINQMRISKNN